MKKNLGFVLLFAGFAWLFILLPISHGPLQRQVIVEQFEGVGPKDTFTREEMLNAIRETAWGMNKHYLTTHWAALAMLVGGFLVAETKKKNGGK